MTRDQQIALRYLRANFGEGSEGGLFLEGLNRPRNTLRSLERRGLVKRLWWENEETGYVYELAEGQSAVNRLHLPHVRVLAPAEAATSSGFRGARSAAAPTARDGGQHLPAERGARS